jgi:hypothetical protein
MGITYVIGDATEPLEDGEANCLCNGTGTLPDPVPTEHLLYVNGVNKVLENQRKAKDEIKKQPDQPGWVY